MHENVNDLSLKHHAMKGHMEHTGRDPAAFTLKRKDYGIHWTRG
jgi:hypothetical protein